MGAGNVNLFPEETGTENKSVFPEETGNGWRSKKVSLFIERFNDPIKKYKFSGGKKWNGTRV